MRNNYKLSKLAAQDIDDIVSYISNENPQAAQRLLDDIFAQLDLLADNPLVGHVRDDLTNKPVRFWTVRSRYLIVYTADNNAVNIIRVLSGYRNITSIL